ncbi:hypothetical protein OC845_000780 [Tilletia horrida]|nr:hypothetical protein OC845_000780 [Tilletia horrida]
MPSSCKKPDIRSYFKSSASTTSGSKRKTEDSNDVAPLKKPRNEISHGDNRTFKTSSNVGNESSAGPGKVHPFFDVRHGRRPTSNPAETLVTDRAQLTSSKDESGRKVLDRDPPLPIPASMFTASGGQAITKFNRSLDLVYWPSFIDSPADAAALYSYLLHNLAWHRVKYYKPRFGQSFSTPRWTTTFGRDDGEDPDSTYDQKPHPVPPVLKEVQNYIRIPAIVCQLRILSFNLFANVHSANGNDSISYHSDDEKFLGPNPSIASLTLGTPRPFLLRRKQNAAPAQSTSEELKPDRPSVLQEVHPNSSRSITRPTYRLPLPPGSLLLMRGTTQHDWEHSIPKSTAKGGAAVSGYGGRMNLTFRHVKKRAGTENFLQYNRGTGPQYRWVGGEMVEAGGGL